jgi:lysozyme family protein
LDIRSLTKADAEAIYRKNYWDKIKGDEIRVQSIAEAVMDHAVNAGTYQATLDAQRALKSLGLNLTLDGGFGPMTLNAINKVDSFTFLPHYVNNRVRFYSALAAKNPEKFGKFLKGWYKRAKSFLPSGGEVVSYLPLLAGVGILTYLYMRNKD